MTLDILENTSTWTAFIRSVSTPLEDVADTSNAFGALYVRSGLEAYASLARQLEDSFRLLWEKAVGGMISNYNVVGNVARSSCRVAQLSARELRRKLEDAQNRGVPSELAASLEKAAEAFEVADRRVADLLQEIEARWPWVDADLYAEGAADREPGSSRPAKEVFNEVRRRIS